jgi:hypothetical protein
VLEPRSRGLRQPDDRATQIAVDIGKALDDGFGQGKGYRPRRAHELSGPSSPRVQGCVGRGHGQVWRLGIVSQQSFKALLNNRHAFLFD